MHHLEKARLVTATQRYLAQAAAQQLAVPEDHEAIARAQHARALDICLL